MNNKWICPAWTGCARWRPFIRGAVWCGAVAAALSAQCTSHSLTLFLRHHNRHYLWSLFSTRELRYFLPKGALLVNVGRRGARAPVIDHCVGRAPRGPRRLVRRVYWLSNTVSINCTCDRRVLQIKEPLETDCYRRKVWINSSTFLFVAHLHCWYHHRDSQRTYWYITSDILQLYYILQPRTIMFQGITGVF